MSYLQKNFAGATKLHSSLTDSTPGFTSRIELGKIYDSMLLQKPRAADYTQLIKLIAEERSGDKASTTGAAESSTLFPDPPKSNPGKGTSKSTQAPDLGVTTGPNEAPVVAAAQPKGETASRKSASFTVSLFTSEIEDVTKFKAKLKETAESLGIAFEIT